MGIHDELGMDSYQDLGCRCSLGIRNATVIHFPFGNSLQGQIHGTTYGLRKELPTKIHRNQKTSKCTLRIQNPDPFLE